MREPQNPENLFVFHHLTSTYPGDRAIIHLP